jgi:DNA-binding response OmpR family regulator
MTNPLTLLVVDDDPAILAATARVLRSAGYTVYEADGAMACMTTVRERRPDLVLLDLVMPDGNGYDLCRQIKTDPVLKDTYVLMCSGTKTGSDDRSIGLEIGADGFMTRPIANRELLARVAAMARIIAAERERDRLIAELQAALAKVKTLSGLLPICANCKKIRDDKGYWEHVEVYVMQHSHADFSHSICPDCMQKLYGDIPEKETTTP